MNDKYEELVAEVIKATERKDIIWHRCYQPQSSYSSKFDVRSYFYEAIWNNRRLEIHEMWEVNFFSKYYILNIHETGRLTTIYGKKISLSRLDRLVARIFIVQKKRERLKKIKAYLKKVSLKLKRTFFF